MTKCIEPSDPRYFTQSCDKPYDRHSYKIVLASGESVITDDYMKVMATWFQNPASFLSHVEIIDKPKTRQSKGFQ